MADNKILSEKETDQVAGGGQFLENIINSVRTFRDVQNLPAQEVIKKLCWERDEMLKHLKDPTQRNDIIQDTAEVIKRISNNYGNV